MQQRWDAFRDGLVMQQWICEPFKCYACMHTESKPSFSKYFCPSLVLPSAVSLNRSLKGERLKFRVGTQRKKRRGMEKVRV